MKYAAIKRSINDDKAEREQYLVKMCASRAEAIDFLLEQYEWWEGGSTIYTSQEWFDHPARAELELFFNHYGNDDAIFQWEWKRRGNCRTYRIVECAAGLVTFYPRAANLYKLKDDKVVRKKK